MTDGAFLNAFHRRLREGPCLLLDGGFGSMLMTRGLPPGTPPDRWNVERPGAVLDLHREYIAAGSEAVHTNTFGSSPIRLARFGLAGSCRAFNESGVRLARRAGSRFVIGDIGPSGERLDAGDEGGSRVRWLESFKTQAGILAEAGADALHVETMSDLREARLALEGARRAAPGLPILVSLAFQRTAAGFTTGRGDSLLESLRALAEAGAAAVGANCSPGCRDMPDLAAMALADEALAAGEARLVFQPSAGEPRVEGAHAYYDADLCACARALAGAARGAAALGGCCGTDPGFIATLRSLLAAA